MPLNAEVHGWPWLRTQAATRLLARLCEDAEMRAARDADFIAASNDAILKRLARETLMVVTSPAWIPDPIDPRRI